MGAIISRVGLGVFTNCEVFTRRTQFWLAFLNQHSHSRPFSLEVGGHTNQPMAIKFKATSEKDKRLTKHMGKYN